MLDFFKEKRIIIGISVLLGVILLFTFFIVNKEANDVVLSDEPILKEEKNVDTSFNFYVDVKGAVKDPGVYLVNDGERVIDAIEKAGGLSKNANTSNINLAQKLVSEMVIVVIYK